VTILYTSRYVSVGSSNNAIYTSQDIVVDFDVAVATVLLLLLLLEGAGKEYCCCRCRPPNERAVVAGDCTNVSDDDGFVTEDE
jgi:hypothetical protein